MPSLHLCGRRWALGSDDFVFSGATEGIIRMIWFCLMVALFIMVFHTGAKVSPCQGWEVRFFLVALIVINTMMIVLSFTLAFISARGTIMNAKERQNIGYIICLRIPTFLAELAVTIFATATVFEIGECSTASLRHFIIIAIILEWVVILAFLISLLLNFDPLGAVHHYEHSMARDHAKGIWRTRLRCLFLCANADDNAKNAFEDIADLMTDFFLESDLVVSDVWAGMLLLANKDYSILHGGACRRTRRSIENQRPAWMTIENAARMMHFALGVYGWPYYMWNNFNIKSWYKLLKGTKCCARCRCDQVLMNNDNCCQCNTSAFKITTQIPMEDLFYLSFHNQIFETPFAACADKITKSIVVVIRGTLSLRDILTDLAMNDEMLPLDCTDQPECYINPLIDQQPGRISTESNPMAGVRVHRGMMKSATFVLRKIDEKKILEDLFVLYPDYDLVITGHSLGAGVAVIVAMLLRQRYPKVRCYAFAPPGCVVSQNGIPLTQDFVFSIVVGDDMVPRLSYAAMRELRENVLDAITNCNRAKYEILIKGCFKLLCGQNSARKPQDDDELIAGAGVNASFDRRRSYGSADDSDVDRRDGIASDSSELPPLRCPGRIMLLNVAKTFLNDAVDDEEPCCIEWLDHRAFCNIKMSSRMVSDHMPTYMKNVLDKASLQCQFAQHDIDQVNRGLDSISDRVHIVNN